VKSEQAEPGLEPAATRAFGLRHRRARLALLAVLGFTLSAACTDEVRPRGQLMIAITSDLAVDKDMDEVRVEVKRADGTVLPDRQIPILPTQPAPFGKPLPGTIAIVPSDAGGQAVHVRVAARHSDESTGTKVSRVVREAIVKIPTDRVALLRMPLHFLCDDKVVPDPDLPDSFKSDCGKDETCKAGKCQPAAVDGDELPDYLPSLVFGGGTSSGKGSHCLDARACFAHAPALSPDFSDCSLPLPADVDLARINVALVLPAKSAGHCLDASAGEGDACYVPLDNDPEGFSIKGGRIQLPPAACERAGLVGVSVSTACRTKDLSVPVCGPWTGWPAVNTEPDGTGGSAGAPAQGAGGETGGNGGSSAGKSSVEPGGSAGTGGKAGEAGYAAVEAGGNGAAGPICVSPPPTGSTTEPLIDDFEDGDNLTVKTGGRNGPWYTFADDLGSTITPEPMTPALPTSNACHNGSKFCLTVSGTTGASDQAFAYVAFDFITPLDKKCAYDGRAYQGIRFWARGNSAIRAKFLTTDVEYTKYGGTCTSAECGDGFGVDMNLSESWRQFELPFATATQQGWGVPSAFDRSRLLSVDLGFLPRTNFNASFDDFAFY